MAPLLLVTKSSPPSGGLRKIGESVNLQLLEALSKVQESDNKPHQHQLSALPEQRMKKRNGYNEGLYAKLLTDVPNRFP